MQFLGLALKSLEVWQLIQYQNVRVASRRIPSPVRSTKKVPSGRGLAIRKPSV